MEVASPALTAAVRDVCVDDASGRRNALVHQTKKLCGFVLRVVDDRQCKMQRFEIDCAEWF